MFCNNCGNKLNGNEEFCPECGNHIVIPNSNQNNKETLSEQLARTNPLKPLWEKIKNNIKKCVNFVLKHKKPFMTVGGTIIILIVGVILFNNLFGFIKFNWNKEYSDFNLKYVTPTNIKLGINFSDEKNIDKIKYSTNCGELKNNGLEVIWDLKETTGKCKITASYKLRKISKEYNIINLDNSDIQFASDYKEELKTNEDYDYDGLTNEQEKEYGTNPELKDSDMDGLDDYYEIFVSKTDPNKKDTDEDGLDDYNEIQLGLDPLNSSSKNDNIKDGDRTLTYNYELGNVKLLVNGKGNIASTTIEVKNNTKISSKNGLIDKLYTFYTDGKMDNANIKISYTDEEIQKYGINEDNLTIYYYNDKESRYEKVETIVDKETKTMTANLTHFSNYVTGDSSLVKEITNTDVLFILDNSWSMYTDEQFEKITGEKNDGEPFSGFDASGIRFTLTSNLISRLSNKNFKIGLSEFRYDYANAYKIGSDTSSIISKLQNMHGNFITKTAGTNIGNALKKGINEFSKDSDNKYIVILTDGEDDDLKSQTSNIIKTAISNNVKICAVGFGESLYNVELANISNGTGCKFYSSSNAFGLTELFENIGAELNDELIDVNDDNIVDGILLVDSGFVVNRDGFSFKNYGTNLSQNGHCYGMATFAELYYKKLLPLNLNSKESGEYTSYGYDLNNTYFSNYSSLYNYKIKTDVLKYNYGFNLLGEEVPSDLFNMNGNNKEYSEKYKEEIINSGLYDIEKIDQNCGTNCSSVERPYLNEDKIQNNNNIENDDKQLLNAIYASYIKQFEYPRYSSGTDFTLWLRNIIGTEENDYSGGKGFINILKSRLEDNDVPVISSSFSGNGLHAINAISLVQDVSNPNYYYIGVYDNNYPGEKRYVDIECNGDTCVTRSNAYYKGSNQPIRITPSLEYDLQFFDIENNY